MKKMISIMLAVTLVLTAVAGIAFAEKKAWGSRVIYCEANAERAMWAGNCIKVMNPNRLYVRHYLYGEYGGVHTNYFRASSTSSYTSIDQTRTAAQNGMTLYGGKWMSPDGAYFVESTSLGNGKYMCPWGRGNTNYGLSRIEISGYFDPDA